MDLKKTLIALVAFVAACGTPSFAQVFWSNQSPAGITDDIWCVTYANGTFAAVTNQGNLLTSPNGLAWSSQAIDPGVWLVSIAYGPKGWVAVGDNGTILVSSDLKTWASVISGTSNKLNGVLFTASPDYVQYNNPNFSEYIAVGDNGTILTSPDGQNWSLQPSGISGFLHGITFSETVGSIWGSILVSGQDGVLLRGLNIATPGFTLINNSGTTQNLEALCSYPINGASVVGVGANGTIIHSNNGLFFGGVWSTSTTAPSTTATFRGLTYGNGYYVSVGTLGTIYTSTNGISWTQRFSGDGPLTLSTSTLLSATFSQDLQRFVVTGTGGTILVSNSPPTVFGNVSTRGYVSSTETLIGGFVIEGTAPRTVLIRADGPVLDTFSVPNPLPDPVLTVYNSSGTVIATNVGWTTNTSSASISTAALDVGAFALPNLSPDSALLLTLQPGAYTAQITSAGGNSGIALFEAYTD